MRAARWMLIAAVAAACQPSPSSPGNATPTTIATLPRALSAGELAIVAAGNSVAPILLARVNQSRAGSNVFMSPLSLSMALGMTMNGAAGGTFDEMRTMLGYGAMSRESINQSYQALISLLRGLDPKVDVRIANSIWYSQRFAPAVAPAFLGDARQYFDATTAALDFGQPSAVKSINDWVKASTKGKIPSIVDALAPEIVMLLVNAIYFKGDWSASFDKAKTVPAPFTTEGGRTVSVSMMHRTGPARVGVHDGRTVVDLGYGGDAFTMSIVLPRENESVNTLVALLSPAVWTSTMAALRVGDVELSLPRFSLEWEATLNDPLKAMGMTAAFVPGGADFTRLAPTMGRELYLSFVKQKTFVDINEAGTEAAAATAVGVGVTSVPIRTVVRVDRPFVFAIRERLSGVILFMGKIVEPPVR